jgi:acyl dehydratase
MKPLRRNEIIFTSDPIVVTYKDVLAFCGVTGDSQGFHLNEQEAASSVFESLIIPGAFISSLVCKTYWEMVAKNKELQGYEVITRGCSSEYLRPAKVNFPIRYSWKVVEQGSDKIFGARKPFINWDIATLREEDSKEIARHRFRFSYIKSNA